MEFAYIFTVCCSLAVLFAVFFYAIKHKRVAGTKAFLLQIVFVSIWAVGSLLELISPTENGMLFWRNFEQIGIFFLPVTCVFFSIEYSGYEKLNKYLPFLWIVPIAALVLIFTDSATHLVREYYIVSYNPLFGKALSVQVKPLGMMFVAYNYLLVFASLVILYMFSRQIAKNMRRQVMLVLFASGLVFFFALLKTAFLEGSSINIPIVTFYLPGSLILFYNLYRNNFFYVSPIARDKVYDVIEQGILVTDSLGLIVDENPFGIKLLNSYFDIHDELVGKKMAEAFCKYPKWVELVSNNAPGELEIEMDNEGTRYIHIKVYPLQSERKTAVGSVTIMRDITSVRLQEAVLKKKAEIDSMTGLLNRESFMNTFMHLLNESAEGGKNISVMMIDIDKFKEINDTFGHDSGDKVIAVIGDLLRGVLSRKDAIGRIGGDEFAAVIYGAERIKAMEIADKILKSADEIAIAHEEGTSIHFSLSIGICDNMSINQAEDMLKCADKAMYTAKNKSRHCCAAWE